MINKVLIIGYGTITKNIIKNITDNSDLEIAVWSRSQDFKEDRLTCSDRINELIGNTDIILSCVPDDQASRAAWTDPTIKNYIAENKIYCMEMSTLSHDYILEWHS